MSKIIIHYFTGTGNTAHAANMIKDHLCSAGHDVKLLQVKMGVMPPNEISDYHIIAFPVLSWAPPVMMKQYVQQMPTSKGTKISVLAINGAIITRKGELVKGYTGQALEQIEAILRRKKYDVFLTGNASFPDNWTQMTNPSSKEDIEVIFPLGENEVKVFIDKFIKGEKDLYRCGFINWLWSYSVAVLFGSIGRKILGKFYIADNNCTGCGICSRTCPAGTIKMWNKKPYWTATCLDCNRCINVCPEKAIQVSVPIFILQTAANVILTIWMIKTVLIYTPMLFQTNQIFLMGIEAVVIILAYIFLLWLACGPIDVLIRLLLRNKIVRRFFSMSYTLKYRRYKAPDFNLFNNTN